MVKQGKCFGCLLILLCSFNYNDKGGKCLAIYYCIHLITRAEVGEMLSCLLLCSFNGKGQREGKCLPFGIAVFIQSER